MPTSASPPPVVHLDTDLGGDIDDLCALALLLRWPGGPRLAAVTTVGDQGGRRAGYARYALDLAGHRQVPVAAGADQSGGYYPYPLGLPLEERYWPEPVPALPQPDPAAALDLLEQSIAAGALILAIGPCTNLALLERRSPGILSRARLALMGGYVYPPRPGFPAWDQRMDFNVQVDARSALLVFQSAKPLLVPLAVTVETALRWAHLPALRRAGALAQLLARQAEAFAADEQIASRYRATCPGLPPDIINFQHDPLACAIALGWRQGVVIEELPLAFSLEEGYLVTRLEAGGKPLPLVTAVDGPAFDRLWLEVVAGEGG
jgi:purine nucleosidase